MNRISKPRVVEMPRKPINGFVQNVKHEPTKQIWHAMGQFIDQENDDDYYAKHWLDRLNLSAHFLIDPSGVIIQCMETDIRGAHAKRNNAGSVGIELLVSGAHTLATLYESMKEDYCTGDQYKSAVHLGAWLKQEGVLEMTRHSEIDPDRKRDPGDGFDWNQFCIDVDMMVETGSLDHLDH